MQGDILIKGTTMHRREFLRTALSTAALPALGAFHVSAASAQDKYPSQPITVIVPFAPGGNIDIIARAVSVPMGQNLKQSVILDNRAGAGGVIGHELAARATPNGYTLVASANGSYAVTPRLIPGRRPFTAADFVGIGMIAVTPLVLEVPAGSPHKTFKDFIAYAKANPGKVSVAHSGNGTTNHVALLRMQEALGIKLNIVPYKGSAPALNDLLGNQVDAMVDQLPSSLPHLRSNKLRALAVTTKSRAPDLPDVATLAELGAANFDISTSAGLLAPAKTPPEIVAQLNKALNAALSDKDVQARIRQMGSVPTPMSVADFQAYLKDEDRKAESLVASGALKAM